MRESSRALTTRVAMVLSSVILCVVCVVLPFHFEPTVGLIVGSGVACFHLLQYIAGLVKRLAQAS